MPDMDQYQTVRRRAAVPIEKTDSLGRHLELHADDLRNTRDLRSLLLDAAYELQSQADLADVHIYLFGCSLAKKRVEMELRQFKSIALPRLAERVLVHDIRKDGQKDMGLDHERARQPSTGSQESVVAYLLQRYLGSMPGVSINAIAEQTKVSIPTIYKALKTYKRCIGRDPEDKTIHLNNFGQADWHYWIQRTNQLSSVYFIDRSGLPRSAKRLAKALANLQRQDLAVGGLLGALHHLPALDATNSPQLDVLVHGTRRTDLSFIAAIDPGLERIEEQTELANLVVHFIDRPEPLFVYQDGQNWGALPDCIANMHKAGLTHQVDDALQLIRQGTRP